jgi:hypothetical protein
MPLQWSKLSEFRRAPSRRQQWVVERPSDPRFHIGLSSIGRECTAMHTKANAVETKTSRARVIGDAGNTGNRGRGNRGRATHVRLFLTQVQHMRCSVSQGNTAWNVLSSVSFGSRTAPCGSGFTLASPYLTGGDGNAQRPVCQPEPGHHLSGIT